METIEEIVQVKLKSLPDDTTLVELGIDSLKMMQVGAYIEETTNTTMYKKDIVALTVGNIKDLLHR